MERGSEGMAGRKEPHPAVRVRQTRPEATRALRDHEGDIPSRLPVAPTPTVDHTPRVSRFAPHAV
jgi:hypothetical protein